jgi:hypothetical protein
LQDGRACFFLISICIATFFELKNTAFKPDHMGQLNFHLTAIDALVRDPKHDAPTICILLCKTKKKTIMEYALCGNLRFKQTSNSRISGRHFYG